MRVNKIGRLAGLLGALLTACCVPAWAASQSVADYLKPTDFDEARLSPSGEYVAAKHWLNGRMVLGVIRVSDRKLIGALQFQGEHGVGDFWWVGRDRVVASIVDYSGPLARPAYLGELVGMDADGSAVDYLFGFRAETKMDTLIQHREAKKAWAWMIEPRTPRPGHSLIKAEYWNENQTPGHQFAVAGNGVAVVYDMDTTSGHLDRVVDSPFAGDADFLVDHAGIVRYAQGEDNQNNRQFWYRAANDAPWKRIDPGTFGGESPKLVAFAGDDKSIYVSADEQGKHCLLEYQIADNQHRVLTCDDDAEPDNIIYSFDAAKRPIAVVFAPGKPEVKLVDSDSDSAKLLPQIEAAFPGQYVRPVSRTDDGKQLLLLVSGDRNPGDYYLFQRDTKKADYLMSRNSWIDPELQAQVKAFSFKARDGLKVWAYLTVPKGVAQKMLPMIVIPHGGPFGIRDRWNWQPEPQLFASRGYSVLQVNFRGSGGYGESFHDAGRYALGTKMIDDLTDGVQSLISDGVVDPKRICIYGASYGGYAALMSAEREPGLYRCAIALAGIYDLKSLVHDSLYGEYARGINFMSEFFGATDDVLWAQSPVANVDQLKAAVMIAHGEQDPIAPFSQAKELREALEQRHYPYEWFTGAAETHGFYDEKTRTAFFDQAFEFLRHNIGNGAAPDAAK